MSDLPVGTISFENVSKRYRLGALGTLRSTVAALRPGTRTGEDAHELWALKDVDFRVEPGEALGLIGPNGAGKTTILKLLSNITRPTSGYIRVGGRISSLIELGAGFHPELSGRDNIFLNGAILGLTRREIQHRLDDIIAFSELERFIDTPVKRYSSGMYVRLGFAVAAHVEPDVLLVDEVLAVGDAAFRQKCMTRMELLRTNGTTLIFVSHNMYQVRRLCTRAVLMAQGEDIFVGQTEETIAVYEELIQSRSQLSDNSLNSETKAKENIFVTKVDLIDPDGEILHTRLNHNQPIVVVIHYHTDSIVNDAIVKLRIIQADGTVVAMTTSRYTPGLTLQLENSGILKVHISPIQLVTGKYFVEVRIIDTSDTYILANGQSEAFVVIGPAMLHEVDLGSFVPNAVWSQDQGERLPYEER